MNFDKIKDSLIKNEFEVSIFDTKEEAADYINKSIDKKTVGFGGSITLKEMNLYELLSQHNTVLNHWEIPDGKTGTEIQKEAMNADVYITSVNAMSETGELVNIDGTGNRIAGTLFGHKKVYFAVGENKIVPTLEDAVFRARNIAAPKNAQRLKRNTPCAIKGDKCYNCSSKDRICKGMTIHYKKMNSCDMEIVIIKESLGY